MLRRITVRDLSLLRDVEISLGDGLTVITGESGSGKSLIFDAVNFAVGGKPHRSLLAQGAKRCEVTLILDLDASTAGRLGQPWQAGENTLLRTMNANGRGKLSLNGEKILVSESQAAAESVFEITGQFESRVLFNQSSHLKVLDQFGESKHPKLLQDYRENYAELTGLRTRLKALEESASTREQEIDFLSFQVDELGKACPQPGERGEVEGLLVICENAERLISAAHQAAVCLGGSDEVDGAYDLAARGQSEIASIADLSAGLELGGIDPADLADRSQEILEMLNELAAQAGQIAGSIQYDAHDLEKLRGRLDEIYRLERKYGCHADELAELHRQKQERLEWLTDQSQSPEALQRQVAAVENSVRKAAAKLSDCRKKAARLIQKNVKQYLNKLDFPHVEMVVDIDQAESLRADGLDIVEFLISLNPGEPARPLSQVASGGETSRLMLGIKAALADRLDFKVMLLDEIEAGLGGGTAQNVAELLKELGQTRQVLAITHLPSVAALGDKHLVTHKVVVQGQTSVAVEQIDKDARKKELARMLGDESGAEERALVERLTQER